MHLGPIYLPKSAITHCHLVLMAQTVRNLKLFLLLHFSSLSLSWEAEHSFYWQREQHRKPEQFIHKNRSDFRGHDNFRDYGYIFTFSALTLLTCSLPVSQCHTRLGPGAELLRQQPPPFSILPGKHLKSQSWDRAVGWERILPTEHL